MFEPFQEEFMRRALLGILLASLNCGVLGVYVVLRRMAFVSTALTHTVLPGMVFAVLCKVAFYWGALGAVLLTALGIGTISNRREMREDTAIGVIFSFMFALGVLLMSVAKSYLDFQGLLFGSILGIESGDLWATGVVTAVIFALLAVFHRQLELSSYDEEYARQCGMSPVFLRILLLELVALSTVSCVKLMGALLTTALLVTPAAAAVLLARTLAGAMMLSAAIGMACGVAGLYISFYMEWPAGAAVVTTCSFAFFAAFLVKHLFRATPSLHAPE